MLQADIFFVADTFLLLMCEQRNPRSWLQVPGVLYHGIDNWAEDLRRVVTAHRKDLIWVCFYDLWLLKMVLLKALKIEARGFVHL